LKRFVDVGGNATGLDLNLGFSYLETDVTGGPDFFLESQYWNGSNWSNTNGGVLPVLNSVFMTGISGNGVLTAFGTVVSVKDRNSTSITVYPNPNHGMVRIQSKGSAEILHLKDILGKEVPFGKTKTEQGFILDLESVSKGIYFLTIRDGNVNSVVRLVKN